MNTFTRFLYEFLAQFFLGIKQIFIGFVEGVKTIFDIQTYIDIIHYYRLDFEAPEWIYVGVAVLILAVIVFIIAAILVLLIRKYLRFRKRVLNEEELLKEVNKLNTQVNDLVKEKEEILAMKVSQLGFNMPEDEPEVEEEQTTGEQDDDDYLEGCRFSKLIKVDRKYANYKQKDYKNNFTLLQLCENFRNFAAYELKLYYSPEMIRNFISGLASTKLVILQGISGTGKTSLAYAWGKFVKHDSCVASVQPSWRDRTDIFGYLNEFTKRFNETDFLRYLYIAGYTDEVYTVILDEMNLARVEYYFAELLSILEMQNPEEWVVEIVSSSWDTDPKRLIDGKLRIPENVWYIGTINNDDSTFKVTDKVYDRAMPIDINEKGKYFEAEPAEPMDINFSYLNNLFLQALADYPVQEETIMKVHEMDDYVIEHFRVAFGNRIMKHLESFVPVYVACGGEEIDAVDYFLARKVLRKFESLNISLIRDEIDDFIKFLDKTFGKGKMKECISSLTLLKKS